MQQVNKWWGVRGEREREQQINGVREGALVRNGNVVDWKWPLVKKEQLSIFSKTNQWNQIGCQSSLADLQFHWCRNIQSHDDMFLSRMFVGKARSLP